LIVANIKKLVGLSEWQTYELDSTILDPPTLRLRMKPINGMVGSDVSDENMKLSAVLIEMVIDAVQEWDIADAGEPIPCTDKNKRLHLPFLLGQKIKGKDRMLGIELLGYAGEIENFIRP
jgi:hypothetical protein